MARHALVTGGSGYFGSILIENLVTADYKVRNYDLNSPVGHPPDVEFVRGDIRDRRALRAAFDSIDVVFHNVAQQPLSKSAELMQSVNVDGTHLALGAAIQAGVEKFVHTSSSAVYGIPAENPITEDTAIAPAEVYGQAKADSELACHQAVRGGLDVTIMRPGTVVGRGRLGVFTILFDWVADGAPVFVLGNGQYRHQLTHAADLASASLLAAERPGPTSYNIGASEFGTMRETIDSLIQHAGTGSATRSLPIKPAVLAMSALSRVGLAPFAPYHWLAYGKPRWFDITKAQVELGWEPRHSNGSMVCEAYDWFMEHRDALDDEGRSLHQRPTNQRALRVLKWLSAAGRRR